MMDDRQRRDLLETALEIRKDVVRVISLAGKGDHGASLALVDLFVFLYWNEMEIRPGCTRAAGRDRFIVSGALGALPALYAALARRGFVEREDLWSFGRLGAILQTTSTASRIGGVDAIVPAPGMALGMALGVALALRRRGERGRVFCCVDLRDLAVGTFWESARCAVEAGVDLQLLVNVCALDEDRERLPWTEPCEIEKALELFGWRTGSAGGHNFDALEASFAAQGRGKAEALVVETRSGRGLASREEEPGRRSEPSEHAKSSFGGRPRLDAALRELDAMRREWER